MQNQIHLKIQTKVKSKSLWPIAAIVYQDALWQADCMRGQALVSDMATASNFRTNTWKEDASLKDEMLKFVKQGLKREEMLSFLRRDFDQYAWSLRTLDRRLRHFEIFYSDATVSVEAIKDAVAKELDGPGKLLGYRAMQKKVRQKHALLVPRDLIYAVMFDLDPEGLQGRAPGKKRTKPKGKFTSKGPNFVHSLDGHDKLMGYQNSTFPLAIYGCLDTASRKLLWLRVWITNSDPLVIGRWYLEYLYESRMMPTYLRVDRGTETGIMATIHAYLHDNHNTLDDASDSVIHGPSTSNQVKNFNCSLNFDKLSFNCATNIIVYVSIAFVGTCF